MARAFSWHDLLKRAPERLPGLVRLNLAGGLDEALRLLRVVGLWGGWRLGIRPSLRLHACALLVVR
jgi:hypothetical protein